MTDIELAKIKSGKVTLKHIQKDDKEDFESVFGECPICFVEISVGNMCTKLTICGHSFHTECIKAWLVKKRSCPKCRAIIDISSSATQAPKWMFLYKYREILTRILLLYRLIYSANLWTAIKNIKWAAGRL